MKTTKVAWISYSHSKRHTQTLLYSSHGYELLATMGKNDSQDFFFIITYSLNENNDGIVVRGMV
jgi:hypothetical protein